MEPLGPGREATGAGTRPGEQVHPRDPRPQVVIPPERAANLSNTRSKANAVSLTAKGKPGDFAEAWRTHQTSRSVGVGSNARHAEWSYPASGGCLEIECLCERAERGQTTKRFSEPPENRMRWPRRRPSATDVTTLREIQTVKP